VNVELYGVEGAEDHTILPRNQGGRPKGSTREVINENDTRNEECKVLIAKAYDEEMQRTIAARKYQFSKGYLAKLIREKKAESSVPKAFYISKRAILS
jgi:hypothetical protein